MKKIYAYSLPAIALALASCADSYDGNLEVEKPDSVVESEHLASLGVLNSYVDKSQNPNFKFGLAVSSADFADKGLTYSIALTNFDCVVDPSAMAYSSIMDEEGAYSLATVSNMFLGTAPSVLGGPMLTYNALPKAHLDDVISANFIKGDLAGGTVLVQDFDGDELGTVYTMSNGSSATVVDDPAGNGGRVLRVGASDDKAKNSYPTFNVSLPDGLTLAGCLQVSFDIYCVDANSQKKNLVLIVNGHRKNFTGDTPDKRGCPLEQWGRKLISLDFSEVSGLTDEDMASSDFTIALGPNVLNTYYYIDNVTISWQTGEPDKYVEKTEAEKAKALADDFGVWANTIMAATASDITDYVVVANPMSDMDTYMQRTAENEAEAGNDVSGCFFFNDYMGDDYIKTVTDSLAKAYTVAGGQGQLHFYVSESGLLGNAAKTQRLVDQIALWDAAGARIDGVAVNLPLTYNEQTLAADKRAVDDLLSALASTGKLVRLDNVSMANADAEFFAYVVSQYMTLIPAQQRAGIIFASTSDLWKNNARTDIYEAVVKSL